MAIIATSSEGSDDDSDENSQGTVVGTIENSLQIVGNTRIMMENSGIVI